MKHSEHAIDVMSEQSFYPSKDHCRCLDVSLNRLLEIFPVKVVNARPLSGTPNDRGVDQLGPQRGDPYNPGSGALLGCGLDNLQQVQSEVHQPKVVDTQGDLHQQPYLHQI